MSVSCSSILPAMLPYHKVYLCLEFSPFSINRQRGDRITDNRQNAVYIATDKLASNVFVSIVLPNFPNVMKEKYTVHTCSHVIIMLRQSREEKKPWQTLQVQIQTENTPKAVVAHFTFPILSFAADSFGDFLYKNKFRATSCSAAECVSVHGFTRRAYSRFFALILVRR